MGGHLHILQYGVTEILLETINLPPTILSPHILTVTDARLCIDSVYLWIPVVRQMNSFMSSVGAICKDDNSGEARVFVQEGDPTICI